MKTLEHINPVVANKLNHPLELVDAVNKWYWKEGIKSTLSKTEHRSIFIPNFGTITISRYKIREKISELITLIRKIEYSTWYGEGRRAVVILQLKEQLRKLCQRRNEIAHAYVKAFGVKVRIRKLTLKDYFKTND